MKGLYYVHTITGHIFQCCGDYDVFMIKKYPQRYRVATGSEIRTYRKTIQAN